MPQVFHELNDDGTDFLCLEELDPVSAKKLMDFRIFLEKKYETLEEAWWHLDNSDALRLSKLQLREACDRIGFYHNTDQLFDFMNTGIWEGTSTTTIQIENMAILGMERDPYFRPGKGFKRRQTDTKATARERAERLRAVATME